jgi:hypothetical protein
MGDVRIAILALAAALAAGAAEAHHSYAMYDNAKEVKIEGTLRELQWTNPHIFLQMLAPDETGKVVEWSLEGGGPGMLTRRGWKFNSVKAGEKLIVAFSPLRDGRHGGGIHYVVKADGTQLGGGGSAQASPAGGAK